MTLSFNKPRPHDWLTGVRYLMEHTILFFLIPHVKTNPQSTQLPNQGSQKSNPNIHLYLLPKLRMHGSLHPLFHNYIFMTCCTGQFLAYPQIAERKRRLFQL